MPLTLLRRALSLLRPAQPAGPLPRPPAQHAAALAAIGATPLPAQAHSLGGRSHLRATLDASAPEGLAALLVIATVAAGPARLRLSGAAIRGLDLHLGLRHAQQRSRCLAVR